MPPLIVEFIDPKAGRKRARTLDEPRPGALPSWSGQSGRGDPSLVAGGGATRFRGSHGSGRGRSPRVEDERTIRASVAALGASGFEGAARKRWEGGQLRATGAVVRGPTQVMPRKMYAGVMKARRAKEAKVEAEALASGVVRPAGAGKKKRRRGERGAGGGGGHRATDEPTPDNIRGPVMRVGR